MRSCLSLPTRGRALAVALFGLALATLSGCGDHLQSYPDDLTYPLRGDAIVMQTLKSEPKTTDRPGELHQILNLYLVNPDDRSSIYDPNGLDANQRNALGNALTKTFGTPAKPEVSSLDTETATTLGLEAAALREGSRLYRQHCLHCHGLTGDGKGPTAAWLNPHPRDFRRGAFKFTSSSLSLGFRRAHRGDILRVLREGIEDASMPSFRLLGDKELEDLVSAVIHLSLRGQVEMEVMKQLKSGETAVSAVGTTVAELTETFVGLWVRNQDPKASISPGPYVDPARDRDSVRRGMKHFLAQGEAAKPGEAASASAGCTSCHVDFGRASTYRFDDWGTIVRPADLTRGLYRGGRRPLDLYWRVHGGINGVGMPAFAKDKPDSKDGFSPQDIWDIVNFLQVLPYPEKHAEYGIDIDTTLAAGKGR